MSNGKAVGLHEQRIGELELRYYGPALDVDHSMSVKTLAPALMHLSDAVETVQKTIAPELDIELKIKATSPGSFDIQLLLQMIGEYSQTMEGKGLEWLTGIIGVGFSTIFIGAIKLVKYFIHHGDVKSVKPIETESAESADAVFTERMVEVEALDGTTTRTYESCLRIAGDRKFVNDAGKAFSGPTSEDGIDGAELSDPDAEVHVDKETAAKMAEWVPKEDIIAENDVRLPVQPLDAHFEPGKKWRVTTGGDTKYTVDMLDDTFIEAVENGERIGKKDIFFVILHTVSYRDSAGKLRARHSITKVLKHIPYTGQNELPLFE